MKFKKYIPIILLILFPFVISFFLFSFKLKKENIKENQYQEQIEEDRANEVALLEDETASENDVNEVPDATLTINNTDFFQKYNFSLYNVETFYVLLQSYLMQNTDIQMWHITLNNFKDNDLFPCFYANVDELKDLTIQCIYDKQNDTFLFRELD